MSNLTKLYIDIEKLKRQIRFLYCNINSFDNNDNDNDDNDDFTIGAVLDTPSSKIIFTRKSGNKYSVDLSNLGEHPVYIPPSANISNVSASLEVGSSVSINITLSFQKNDAGNPISYSIEKNNTEVSNTTTFLETLVVPLGNTTYRGTVNYEEGDCKYIGTTEDCTGRIEAGNVNTVNRTVIGGYRRYAGSVSDIPTNGANLRSTLLSTSVINTSNNFTFTTGTTNRRFVIAIPSTKNLVNVTNSGTNEDLTTGFVLSSITTIPDAAGNNVAYKVYIIENAIPFSTNYTIQVTLN